MFFTWESIRKVNSPGAWVAQSVKWPTLGFRSGRDLMVRGFEPSVRLCLDTAESAWDSLSLSLKINKTEKRKEM